MGVFLILFLVILFLYFTSKNISLYCFSSGGAISCRWSNCLLKYEGSELMIVKAPDYVEVVRIEEEAGSTVFSPSPFAGTYTALLSCENGEAIQKISVG